MIKYETGDLFSVTSGIIAHGCNAQSVMGSGVAKQIKQYYPTAYWDYLIMPMKLGRVELTQVTKDLWVANCITQEFYGRDKNRVYVSYTAMSMAMHQLASFGKEVHIPMIGAGLANGDWNRIEQIIKHSFEGEPANITIWRQ